jgi:magnesium-transporting ATPase (P-type)
MSVIVKRRDLKDSDYFVFCKGADSAMLQIIEKNEKFLKNVSSKFYFN